MPVIALPQGGSQCEQAAKGYDVVASLVAFGCLIRTKELLTCWWMYATSLPLDSTRHMAEGTGHTT